MDLNEWQLEREMSAEIVVELAEKIVAVAETEGASVYVKRYYRSYMEFVGRCTTPQNALETKIKLVQAIGSMATHPVYWRLNDKYGLQIHDAIGVHCFYVF